MKTMKSVIAMGIAAAVLFTGSQAMANPVIGNTEILSSGNVPKVCTMLMGADNESGIHIVGSNDSEQLKKVNLQFTSNHPASIEFETSAEWLNLDPWGGVEPSDTKMMITNKADGTDYSIATNGTPNNTPFYLNDAGNFALDLDFFVKVNDQATRAGKAEMKSTLIVFCHATS